MASWRLSGLLVFCFVTVLPSAHGDEDMRCYECTSYMNHCKTSVDNANNMVFKTFCPSKCYTRVGEDGATYRGCAAHFEGAGNMQFDYVGCRNQSWNNQNLLWCLCDESLCNDESFQQLAHFSRANIPYQAPVNEGSYIHRYPVHGRQTGREVKRDYTYQEPIPSYHNRNEGTHDGERKPEVMKTKTDFFNPVLPFPGHYAGEKVDHFPGQDESQINGNKKPVIIDHGGLVPLESPQPWGEPYYAEEGSDPGFREGWIGHESALEPTREKNDSPNKRPFSSKVSPKLASQIHCAKTGYFQNPHDCRQFVACLMDPNSERPIMHLMNCPPGLVFDSRQKICMLYSSTCDTATRELLINRDFRNAPKEGREDDKQPNKVEVNPVSPKGNHGNIPQVGYGSTFYVEPIYGNDDQGFFANGGSQDTYGDYLNEPHLENKVEVTGSDDKAHKSQIFDEVHQPPIQYLPSPYQ